jgi:hypothetical protein
MKITEQDRETARQERAPKTKMSAEAIARLRNRNEEQKRIEADEARVCAEFMKLRRDIPNYMHAIWQIWKSGPIPFLERMAMKLLACVESGLVPTRAHDIVFMATLSPTEAAMTDEQFETELKIHSSMKHRKKEAPVTQPKPSRYSLEYKQAQMARRNGQNKENTACSPLILKGKNSRKSTPGPAASPVPQLPAESTFLMIPPPVNGELGEVVQGQDR